MQLEGELEPICDGFLVGHLGYCAGRAKDVNSRTSSSTYFARLMIKKSTRRFLAHACSLLRRSFGCVSP